MYIYINLFIYICVYKKKKIIFEKHYVKHYLINPNINPSIRAAHPKGRRWHPKACRLRIVLRDPWLKEMCG